MREDKLEDMIEILVVLTQLKDYILLRPRRVGEWLLDIRKEVEQICPGLPFVYLQTVRKGIDDRLERRDGSDDLGALLRHDILLQEEVDGSLQLETGKLKLLCTTRVDCSSNILFKLRRYATIEGGQNLLSMRVGEIYVSQGGLNGAKGGKNGSAVIEA